MSTDLTIDNDLNSTGQFVKDHTGNTSKLSLTNGGNVGIGTITPEKELDVNGPIRLKASALGKGLFFADSDFSIGAIGDGFRIQKGGWRIIEVIGKDRLAFDNVDVYPDNDEQQSLGLEDNRWAKLYVVEISCSNTLKIENLEQPPIGADVVDLVMDKNTGKIHRKV